MPAAGQIYSPLTAKHRISFWKLLPWTGIGSLLLAFGCGIAALVIGIVSDGLPQNSWTLSTGTIQPSVLLSSAATLANAFLRVAFAEGVVIQWWLYAHQGVSIGHLCALYAHGYTSMSLLTMFFEFSKVTFAGFAMFLLLVDGPFLQKASSIHPVSRQSFRDLTVPISPSPLVLGSTGIITQHDGLEPNLYTTTFAQVMQHYGARDPISIPQFNYSGTLKMNLVGPGWDIQCTNGSSPFRLISDEEWYQSYYYPDNYTGPAAIQTMFQTTVKYGDPSVFSSGTILLNSSYKSTPGGNGTQLWRSCTLKEALIRYPLQVIDGIVSLQPMPISENRTEYVISREYEMNTWGSSPSTVGGVWIALANQFATSANISLQQPNIGIEITNENAIANEFVTPNSDLTSYNVTWSDPIDAIIAAANEITLRAAINLTHQNAFVGWCGATCTQPEVIYPNLTTINRTTSQQASVTMVTSVNVYQTDLAWLLSGFAVIAITCISTALMYWGWWRLERNFTLNPLETAKAFDAPLLRNASSDTSPAAWTRSLKGMRVYYGTGQYNAPSVTAGVSQSLMHRATQNYPLEAVDEQRTVPESHINLDRYERGGAETLQFEVAGTSVTKFWKVR